MKLDVFQLVLLLHNAVPVTKRVAAPLPNILTGRIQRNPSLYLFMDNKTKCCLFFMKSYWKQSVIQLSFFTIKNTKNTYEFLRKTLKNSIEDSGALFVK